MSDPSENKENITKAVEKVNESEYSLSFVVQKLILPDEKYEDVSISVIFSDYVVKIKKVEELVGKGKKAPKKAPVKKAGKGAVIAGPVEEEPFLKGLELTQHFIPEKLAETLKLNPIIFHVERGQEVLGK